MKAFFDRVEMLRVNYLLWQCCSDKSSYTSFYLMKYCTEQTTLKLKALRDGKRSMWAVLVFDHNNYISRVKGDNTLGEGLDVFFLYGRNDCVTMCV